MTYPKVADLIDVPGCPGYFFDKQWRIWGRRDKPLEPHSNRRGYLSISIKSEKGGFKEHTIHRLICEAAHGPPLDGQVVRHLDGNSRNNDPKNLKWGSHLENAGDRALHYFEKTGTTWPEAMKAVHGVRRKLSPEQVQFIKQHCHEHAPRGTKSATARKFGVSEALITKALRGRLD